MATNGSISHREDIMIHRSLGVRICPLRLAAIVAAAALVNSSAAVAQAPAGKAAPAGSSTAVRIELTDGTQARYRVREQLAGISFPSDAVGRSDTVSGVLLLNASGAVVSDGSRLTLDLRTFKSDQDRRDNYLQRNTFELEKFPPYAEFVPRRVEGLPFPFPSEPPAQAGFRLIGDMTMHGVTSEIAWNVVATFLEGQVSGIATTSFPFSTFNLAKPSLARLLSVDDTINLELEFRATVAPVGTH
jgi:hypothetical protein